MTRSILAVLETAIQTRLNACQCQLLVARLNSDLPPGEVARRFGANRNALYKVLHDDRLKLEQALVEAGITARDVRSLR